MLERFLDLKKQIGSRIGRLGHSNVSPNNRIVKAYFHSLQDVVGNHVSKGNRIIHADLGKIEDNPPQSKTSNT